ncbi:MAG: HAD family hydrolase [Anaerolineales bacterium]|nr:HAD family hydrolase [Anaerolineales bacterium]
MNRRFEVIFFDLGDTLMYDKDPWDPIFPRADAAMRESLERAGYPLAENAYGDFDTIFDLYYHRRKDTIEEETTVQLLRELMETQGDSPPDPVLFAAMEAMYAITQENWYVEEDAAQTLETLRKMGYRLGMISNAADDENVQELVDKGNLRSHFEFILSSAACGIRKPDARIFQLALDHFKVPPEKTVMVGDTLEADISGANQIGMYSIWASRHAKTPPEGELPIQPQAVISSLSELPKLLKELEEELP